jgi:hypothetical protein
MGVISGSYFRVIKNINGPDNNWQVGLIFTGSRVGFAHIKLVRLAQSQHSSAGDLFVLFNPPDVSHSLMASTMTGTHLSALDDCFGNAGL